MNLTVEQMQHAIGIASVQVTGLREMFGSDTKSFHPGRAAQNGILAAVLAENGYTSSLTALEAKRGWANCVSTSNDLDVQIGSLGKVWETELNAFKPFPCGIVCHPAIDACIQLHAELVKAGVKPADLPEHLESVMLKVHPLVIELTSKRTPCDGLEAKFSVFHGCAVGLLYGKAGPAEYADEVVARAEVVAVRDKIDAAIDGALGADQCTADLKLTSGASASSGSASTFSKHISHAIGSLEVPMTDAQLQRKFLDQCGPVLGSGVGAASELCWKLADVEDVAEISRAL